MYSKSELPRKLYLLNGEFDRVWLTFGISILCSPGSSASSSSENSISGSRVPSLPMQSGVFSASGDADSRAPTAPRLRGGGKSQQPHEVSLQNNNTAFKYDQNASGTLISEAKWQTFIPFNLQIIL